MTVLARRPGPPLIPLTPSDRVVGDERGLTMMSGDQFKAYVDHGKDTPVSGPNLIVLYVVTGAALVGIALVAAFGWTATSLVLFATVALALTAVALVVRSRLSR